jgi:hypothetical protein
MAFIHTLRNRPFVVCFLPSSNYPPETKISRPNSTPHSQTSSNNKNKRRRNPPPKTKQEKNSHKTPKHSSTTEPPSLSFFFTTTTTQLQNPKPDLDAS